MNREILFRAKLKDDYFNKGWQYGLVYCTWFSGSIFKYWLTPIKKENLTTFDTVCVNPETICQYTGLTDKNGTKIFEGDILQGDEYPYCSDGDYNYYAEVVWFDNGCCGFGLCTHKNPKSSVRGISDGNCEWFEEFSSSNWLVIGNVYDNPELLQENS